MIAKAKFKNKFYQLSVHMSHWKNTQNFTASREVRTDFLVDKIHIAPQGSIRQHYTFGKSRCSAGVIDHCQFFRVILVITHMFFAEKLRILMSKHLIKMFTSIG